MSTNKQMNPELLEALKAAGLVVTNTTRSKKEYTVEEASAKILELEILLSEAKAIKDIKAQKKIRRQQRSLGFFRSQFNKEVTE
jgi:hypothetical protein